VADHAASCDITRGNPCDCGVEKLVVKVSQPVEDGYRLTLPDKRWRMIDTNDPRYADLAEIVDSLFEDRNYRRESYEPTEEEYQELVADMKREILADLGTAKSSRGSFLPLSTNSFSMLHDYVDANEYGGLCDPKRRSHWLTGDAGISTLNRAQTEVDEWLASGEARTEKIAMWLYDATYDPPGYKVGWDEISEDARQHWRNHAKRMQSDLLIGIEEGVI
jgi:hypothetical protein